MKRLVRALTVMLCLSMLFCTVSVFAEEATNKTGWRTDSDGKERYYVDGTNYLTGTQQVGNHFYVFAADGECLGAYDGYTNAGTPGVMDTAEFKNAVATVSPFIAETFDAGRTFGNFTVPFAEANIGTNNGSNFQSGVQSVLRVATFSSVPKNNGDPNNYAYKFSHIQNVDEYLKEFPNSGGSPSSHTYMHKNNIHNLASNGEIVIDFEVALQGLHTGNISVITVMDRNNGDPGDSSTVNIDSSGLLSINNNGYLFSPRKSGYLLAKLNIDTLTRISVSVHKATNTFDVYVNGVKVLAGATMYEGTNQTPEEYRIEEFRMFELGSNATTPNGAIYVLDNLYMYNASAPVCTSNEAPKNGFIAEGSYLRYYENGAARVGKYPVVGDFFGHSLNGVYTTFESGNGAAFIGYKATVVSEGVVVSSGYADQNKLEIPKAVDMTNKKFVGWNVTGSVYLPNETTRLSADTTVESVGVEFSLVKGAAMGIDKKTSNGLMFAARINAADYNALVSLGAKIEPHIVTVATDTVRGARGYIEPEHLMAVEGAEQPVDTIAEGWLEGDAGYYYYGATVSGITDMFKEYSAIAYLRITIPGGQTIDIYADYDEANNSRALYDVATKAYNDRVTAKADGYSSVVAFKGIKTYSPYSGGERDSIREVLDKVICIETDEDSVNVSGSFYDAPYSLKYVSKRGTYDVTIESKNGSWKPSEAVAVIVDGEKLAPEAFVANEDTCTLSADSGKIDLYVPDNVVIDASAKSWKMFTSEDAACFTGVSSSPASYGGEYIEISGQSRIAYWKFSDKGSLNFNNSAYAKEKYTNGYYDFSEFQALEFSVYAPSGCDGATFYVQFISENPATTDGTDYYGMMVSIDSEGWNNIIINKKSLGSSRTPLGWNKITGIVFTSTGWEQKNKTSTTLYLSDITAYDKPIESKATSGHCKVYTVDGAAMFTIGGFAASIGGKTYNINPENTDVTVFEQDGRVYLPVNSFAVANDRNAVFYSNSCVVKFKYDEDPMVFKAGNTYYLNGEEKPLQYPAIAKEGALFISVEDAMAIFEYSDLFIDRMGLVVLSNEEFPLDSVEDQSKIFMCIKELMYIRPTGEQMYADLMEYSGGQHPYLLVDGAGFEQLKYYSKHDATLKEYIDKTVAGYGITSAKYKIQTQWYRRTDGRRLLEVSRDVMNKMLAWGLIYHLSDYTPEEKQLLVNRVWKEAEAACNFFNDENNKYSWNPEHYLDTGEMSYAIGIAYDWFYDAWTVEQRSMLAKALYDLGLNTTSVLVGGGANYNLAGATNNWNGVCNGGIMVGALAIVNDAYIVSNGLQGNVIDVIGASVKGIESGMWVYGPDGGYEEGPGYWGYGTTYCMVFMAALNSACGTNYGLYYTPGFATSAYFTTYLGNANTTWGFHDGGSGDSNPSIASWFALMSGDGNLNAIRRQGIEKGWCGSSLYDIMFFSPHIINHSIDLTLDAYYSLDTIMTFRSSWDTSDNIFAGLHGGDNAAGHGDLDIGNFVINVNGTYMICDLGSDSYNMAGYFGGYRWSYYRKRTEGQNTLVMLGTGSTWDGKTGKPEYYVDSSENIVYSLEEATYIVSSGVMYNLEDGKLGSREKTVANTTPDPNYYGQKAKAISKALAFESGANSAYGIVDMAPAYNSVKGGNMRRGLYMTNNRNVVVIQDEGTFSSNQDIWWFAHTQGEIEVSEDGKSAFIYRNGIYLYAEIITDPNNPVEAKFEAMDAESLDKLYVGDTINSGVYTGETEGSRASLRKLVINVKKTKVLNIAVAFTVVSSPAAAPSLGQIYAWTPMNDWKAI